MIAFDAVQIAAGFRSVPEEPGDVEFAGAGGFAVAYARAAAGGSPSSGKPGTVLFVALLLGFPLPFGWCLAAIALSAWLNIFFTIRWRSTVRLPDRYAALLLGYDILQLAVLLYLTGGLQNPFAFLFLVPVTVSASSLSLKWTLWLSGLAFLCTTFLTFGHYPLPWFPGERLQLPQIYLAGMWSALVSGVVFAAIYARRISEEARQMSTALSATELVLAREQRLSALDGLAAAAAHELGTPLATIALVAKELKREVQSQRPYQGGYRPPDQPVGALPRNSLAPCQPRRAGRRDVCTCQPACDDRRYRGAPAGIRCGRRYRRGSNTKIAKPNRPASRSSSAIRR